MTRPKVQSSAYTLQIGTTECAACFYFLFFKMILFFLSFGMKFRDLKLIILDKRTMFTLVVSYVSKIFHNLISSYKIEMMFDVFVYD